MNVRTPFLLALAFSVALLAGAKQTHKLIPVKKTPDGISKQIAAVLNPDGYGLHGPEGAILEVWLVKELAIKTGFKPTLAVKYPFSTGQLVGVIRVVDEDEFSDFRGQEMAAGVYTLRYAEQPEDGEHIGTSDLYDFLLAIPAKDDVDPKPIPVLEKLNEKSAQTVESDHPAIFSLLPVEKASKTATLTHDEDYDFWILTLNGLAKTEKNGIQNMPVRMVAIGQSEE